MDPIRHDNHQRQWVWQLLTHPRVAETLLLAFALGVILTLSAASGSAEATNQPGGEQTVAASRGIPRQTGVTTLTDTL
jgi:hypothetical protein